MSNDFEPIDPVVVDTDDAEAPIISDDAAVVTDEPEEGGKKKKKKKKAKAKRKKKTREPRERPSGSDTPKPGLSVYTIMLAVALIAISIACGLLYLELTTYGDFPWWKASATPSS